MNDRGTVFVPAVVRGASERTITKGRLIELYSQRYTFGDDVDDVILSTDMRAKCKLYDRVCATLNNRQLYNNGLVAVGAVKKHAIDRPRLALYQRMRPSAWIAEQRLQINPKPDYALVEGASCQLALALCLLRCASTSRTKTVIATGALAKPDGFNGPTLGHSHNDSEVFPVNSLAKKCQILIEEIERGEFPGLEGGERILFFTPRTYEIDGEFRDTTTLPEIIELQDKGVEVVPISWLSEAGKRLKISHAPYVTGDRIVNLVLSVGFSICLFALASCWWSQWSLPSVEYVPGVKGLAAEPYRVCTTIDSLNRLPLNRNGALPRLKIEDALGVNIKVSEKQRLVTMVEEFLKSGYALAVIMLSDTIHIETWTVQSKLEFVKEIAFVPPGGMHGLIFLMQRTAFNENNLRERIGMEFGSPIDFSRDSLNTVLNFIQSLAPRSTKPFVFETTNATLECE